MNNFLEEKEKLLNSIENNTTEHWKEYYKDVPLDCIFDDLVIDINDIKRLTEENKQLKGSLQTHEILLKENVEENQNLKQKEFIEWLTKESKEIIRDAGYHQRICEDILEKYKEIIGVKDE